MNIPEFLQDTEGEWSAERRPRINVDNGDGFIEVAEVSCEHPGGDWTDIGYFFNADIAKACSKLPLIARYLRTLSLGGNPEAMAQLARKALEELGCKP